jgi:hypothetical protein
LAEYSSGSLLQALQWSTFSYVLCLQTGITLLELFNTAQELLDPAVVSASELHHMDDEGICRLGLHHESNSAPVFSYFTPLFANILGL